LRPVALRVSFRAGPAVFPRFLSATRCVLPGVAATFR